FLRINPRGRVPVLQYESESYTEASAILLHIGASYPDAGLLPDLRSSEGLRCLEWLGWFSGSLHVAFMQQWRPERFLPTDSDQQELVENGKLVAAGMMAEVEGRIASTWLLGDRYSLADIYAFPFYGWGNRAGLDMARMCPAWSSLIARMLKRSA